MCKKRNLKTWHGMALGGFRMLFEMYSHFPHQFSENVHSFYFYFWAVSVPHEDVQSQPWHGDSQI